VPRIPLVSVPAACAAGDRQRWKGKRLFLDASTPFSWRSPWPVSHRECGMDLVGGGTPYLDRTLMAEERPCSLDGTSAQLKARTLGTSVERSAPPVPIWWICGPGPLNNPLRQKHRHLSAIDWCSGPIMHDQAVRSCRTVLPAPAPASFCNGTDPLTYEAPLTCGRCAIAASIEGLQLRAACPSRATPTPTCCSLMIERRESPVRPSPTTNVFRPRCSGRSHCRLGDALDPSKAVDRFPPQSPLVGRELHAELIQDQNRAPSPAHGLGLPFESDCPLPPKRKLGAAETLYQLCRPAARNAFPGAGELKAGLRIAEIRRPPPRVNLLGPSLLAVRYRD